MSTAKANDWSSVYLPPRNQSGWAFIAFSQISDLEDSDYTI